MATGMLPFRPAVVRAGIDDRRSNQTRTASSSGKWWAPLFGFSSDPDYINPDGMKRKPAAEGAKNRFEPGSFTEEKARQLRRMTNDATSSYEDSMYRSAVASRLASDFSDRAAA